MVHIETTIAVVKTLTLGLGALITLLSAQAYGRTGSRPLRALSIGFGIVTLGAVVGGVFDLLLSVDLLVGVLVQSTLTLVGFATITYSLYMTT